MNSNKIKLDDGAKLCLVIILISQLFFLNGIYLFLAFLCLYGVLYFLQLPFKASVFTIIFIYHFLQVIAGVWQASYLDKDINYRSASMGIATITSLIGLIIMFFPIMYFQNKIPNINRETLRRHADKLSINKTYYAYLVVFFAAGSLNSIRFLLPGYTQFIISIVNLKWFFLILFGFQSILKNKRKKEFYFLVVLEFVLGFYSFFSDFKTVIFFVAVIFLTMIDYVSLRRFIVGTTMLVLTFMGGTIWTTIKVEYRKFLNQGSVSQNVEVSENEAFSKLYEITYTQGKQVTTDATEKFLDRLQGTYHLAKTMDRVPDLLPYENGKNWLETFEYVLTPRLFNPDKAQLNTSVKASKYTGIRYAGLAQGTAFSLGYFADSYIDFGLIGMHGVLLLIGLLLAITYFYFLRNTTSNYIFNYSVVCALFMRYFAFEMDSIFFIGSLLTDLLTYFILSKLFFPWLYRFLLASPDKHD